MRTKVSTCRGKKRFIAKGDAERFAEQSTPAHRPYRCNQCWLWHLSSRKLRIRRTCTVVAQQPPTEESPENG
jgi:hypothetical protein